MKALNVFERFNISLVDRTLAVRYISGLWVPPDLTITTEDDKPYLFRWHTVERSSTEPNVYFHLQVASDPERPLHDHPWDNMTALLVGRYDEEYMKVPFYWGVKLTHSRKPREVIFRHADQPHRLILPKGVPYVMTQFTTGPKIRDWGFWIGNKWYNEQECLARNAAGGSVFHYPKGSNP